MNPFSKIVLWYRTRWFFSLAIIAGSLCLLLVLQELYSYRTGGIGFCDFEVYHRAAGRLLDGENLFREAEDGHFVFKYSPTAALLFVPFSFFPLWLAKILYWLFLSFAIVTGFCLSLFIVDPDYRVNPARTNGLLLLAAIVMWPHIWSEFTFGQVNYLLTAAYVCAAWLFIRKKASAAGALLAFTMFVKPYGLIFVPYLVIKKRFRELGWFLVFVTGFFLLPAVFYRSGEFLAQQREWISDIGLELGGKQDILREGNHTIFSLLARYSPLDRLAADSEFFQVFPFIVVTLIGVLALCLFIRGNGLRNAGALDFAFMLALMPLISYTTDNAFSFTALAVMLLIFNYGALGRLEKILVVPGLIFVSFDLWFLNRFTAGTDFVLIDMGNNYSLLGIGTVILVAVMAASRFRGRL